MRLTLRQPLPDSSTHPEIVSLRTRSAQGKQLFDWHEHRFHEFTLVTDDKTEIGLPEGWSPAKPHTLFHYPPGFRHGARVGPGQSPRFWVVHFNLPTSGPVQIAHLSQDSAELGRWDLTRDQAETFQWMFLQVLNERSAGRDGHALATSAWLQIMLVTINRWVTRNEGPELNASTRPSPEVLRLWHLINESVGKPTEELAAIYNSPNYDSTRHAFRRTFGCSPREMLFRLRMEHAQNLLLESNLSIKEISERTGYARQHEFYRAFRRHVGCAPSEWRADPLVRR